MPGKPVGVTLGWSGHPAILFKDEKGETWVLPRSTELLCYEEYWHEKDGSLRHWPIDPITSEKLPIYDFKDEQAAYHERWNLTFFLVIACGVVSGALAFCLIQTFIQ
jgi:hypothetical protein